MRLAARGACDLDLGPKPLDDPVKVAALRRRAWVLVFQAAGCAAALAALVWVGAAR